MKHTLNAITDGPVPAIVNRTRDTVKTTWRDAPRAAKGHSRRGKQSKTYNSWMAMKARCLRPKNNEYHRYGARGIKVCERWLSFANFLEDMGERPEGMTLDRKDSTKDYCPENCRWADARTQCLNRSNNRIIEFQGKTQTLTEWAEELGVPMKLLHARIVSRKWPVEKALTTPIIEKYSHKRGAP